MTTGSSATTTHMPGDPAIVATRAARRGSRSGGPAHVVPVTPRRRSRVSIPIAASHGATAPVITAEQMSGQMEAARRRDVPRGRVLLRPSPEGSHGRHKRVLAAPASAWNAGTDMPGLSSGWGGGCRRAGELRQRVQADRRLRQPWKRVEPPGETGGYVLDLPAFAGQPCLQQRIARARRKHASVDHPRKNHAGSLFALDRYSRSRTKTTLDRYSTHGIVIRRSDIANHPSEHVANRREEFERVLDDGDARHGDSSALPLDWPWVPLSHDGTTVATKS